MCNVKISTGFQYKTLTYMSYGIPVILSINAFVNTKFKKNKEEVFVNWFRGISKKYMRKECEFFDELIEYIIRIFDLKIYKKEVFLHLQYVLCRRFYFCGA